MFFLLRASSSLSLANHLSRPARSPVKRSTTVAQAFRSLFRRDIALRLSHEFVADEELPHSRAAQERRVEVNVEVGGFDFFGGAGEGSLVEAHACCIWLVGCSSSLCGFWTRAEEKLTVREVRLEQIVISSCNFRHDLGEVCAFLVIEIRQSALMSFGNDHDFEWPSSPPGTASPEALVLENCAFALLALQLGVVFQQVAVVVVTAVLLHALEFNAGLFGQAGGCPRLAVWVRV
jgi:hypothetical protein